MGNNTKPHLMLSSADLTARIHTRGTSCSSLGLVRTSTRYSAQVKQQQTYLLCDQTLGGQIQGGQTMGDQKNGIQLSHIPGQPPVAQRRLLQPVVTTGRHPPILPNVAASNKQLSPLLGNQIDITSTIFPVTTMSTTCFPSADHVKALTPSQTLQSHQTHIVLLKMVSNTTAAVYVPLVAELKSDLTTLPAHSLNSRSHQAPNRLLLTARKTGLTNISERVVGCWSQLATADSACFAVVIPGFTTTLFVLG